MDNTLDQTMTIIGMKAKAAAGRLSYATYNERNMALEAAAEAMQLSGLEIIEANKKDLELGRQKGLGDAMMDRLFLNQERVDAICHGLRSISELEDPVGRELDSFERPNGLSITKVSTPIGVIGVVYESRPNVTADAGALALKSGNAVILRGGSECFHTSGAIHECLICGLREAGLPETAIQMIPTKDRAAVQKLLKMTDYIDVIVPRGGKDLVSVVQKSARVPVFAHLEGIVHIFVDKSANRKMAGEVILNSKTRRVGICGAAECLLLHKDTLGGLAEALIEDLITAGVEVRVGEGLQHIAKTVQASDADWGKEFLDNIISVRLVENVTDAISFIQKYGSFHTDCIITEDEKSKNLFFERLDSAILMHNASTQFADGGEFGMGAEIGIATGKLHARGPVGAQQLTSFKYLVSGNGAIRK